MFKRHQFNVLTGLLAFSLIGGFISSASSFAESATPVTAVAPPMIKQNLASIKTKITEFLETQTIGYPGKVSVHAGAIDPNLKLAQCPDMQVFMPTGSRAWGKTSVGVRCNAPNVWTIYVQATVNVIAQYLVAASPLAQGQTVTEQDMMFESGDLTQLPAGVFTEQSQAIGRTVNISMNAGAVLRQELLKVAPVVQLGQTVMVTSKGNGFSVSAEGLSMAKANEGQVVQVKVASGQIVTGIARNGGQVEVGF
ncbi:flagellar basal body P-ring formation chaperone FlgA [Methylotenera versatilis]|uniref:Flagella basal body P-ring formation protein FlgA n=1 Tax=Methylotenera versatilis (strain 301) TaxID=666681 RepID=D7DJ49_METV0|nr:flagellar basal body P-ring formation chaperone FlgA [Methylotenera versatilis]ADI30084.1 flagella basal body P-ring formation protein FlgA [Methylotenera versatilis 301]